MTHHLHTVAIDQKRAVLTHVLTQEAASQALVFCKTKRGSDRVGEHLERAGIKTAVIHGNKSQGARTRALGDFKAGVSTCWWPPTSRRAASTSRSCPWSSTTTCRSWPKTTFTESAAPAGPDAAGAPCRSCRPSDSRLLRDIQRLLPAPLEQIAVEGFEATHAEPSIPRADSNPAIGRTATDSSGRNETRSGTRDTALFRGVEPPSLVDELDFGSHRSLTV